MNKQTDSALKKIAKTLFAGFSFKERDLKQFSTLQYKLESRITSNVDKLFKNDRSFDVIKQAINEFSVSEWEIAISEIVSTIKADNDLLLRKNKKYKLFNSLLTEIAKINPLLPAMVLAKRVDLLNHLKKVCEPFDIFEQIKKTRGEEKARHSVRLYHEVTELAYYQYLSLLWTFSLILKKDKKKCPESLGALCRELPKRLPMYSDLINTEVPWIRNACAHKTWKYDPKNKNIILWDRAGKKEVFTSKELILKSSEMIMVGGFNLQQAVSYQVVVKLLNDSGLGKALLKAVKKFYFGTDLERTSAESELNNELKSIFRFNAGSST